MVPFTPVRSCVQTGCDRQRRGWVGWGVGGGLRPFVILWWRGRGSGPKALRHSWRRVRDQGYGDIVMERAVRVGCGSK